MSNNFRAIFLFFLCSLFLILNTSCSYFGRVFSDEEYSFKINDKIRLGKNNKVLKFYLSKKTSVFFYLTDFYNNVKKELATLENFKIVEDVKDADYIINITLLNSSTINYNTAKLLRNYIALENSVNNFYSDANNNIHVNNEKSFFDAPYHMIKEEEKIDKLTKTSGSAIIGGSIGYLAGQSLTAFGIGALAALPAIILTDEAFQKIGYIMTFEVEVLEILNTAVHSTRKIIQKQSSNSIIYADLNEKIELLPRVSKIIVLGTGSFYTLESIKKKMIDISEKAILELF